jgi:hypothetical protein
MRSVAAFVECDLFPRPFNRKYTMRTAVIAVFSIAALATTFEVAAADEPFTLTIPTQGWTIAFASPPLRDYQGEAKDKSFVFRATEEKNFNLSVFVEQPKNKDATHEACFNYYWPLAKRNPMIDQGSVKVEKGEKFVKVTYLIKAGPATASNANFYFAFQGRWIDVHASYYPSAADDEQKLAAFEKSLSYEVTKNTAAPKQTK